MEMKEKNKIRTEKFSLSEKHDPDADSALFSVPEDYFKNLHATILLKTQTLTELERRKAEDPFGVPANYLESLPSKVHERIRSGDGKPVRNEWVTALLRPQISLSLLSFLLMIFFAASTFRTQVIEVPSGSLAEPETENSYELMLLDEDILIEEFVAMDNFEAGENLSDPYVQFLIENNIELSQIEQIL
jgi:hypothetical protein